MEIFLLFSFILLVTVSLVQSDAVRGDTGLKIRSTEPPIVAKTCPNYTQISPCRCSPNFPGLEIWCEYTKVTQTSIENAFRELRLVNEIPQDRGIRVYEFGVWRTEMTELDLAPFYGSQIDRLAIHTNLNLTKLVTSENPQDHGSIHANFVQVRSCPLLNRDGLGDFLKHFSNEMTEFVADSIDLKNSNNSEESEFLPGLSNLKNLTRLYLTTCNITGALNSDRWDFKGLSKLTYLSFGYNQINGIGENVLDFGGEGVRLEVQLQYNQLNETSFHPNSGISRTDRNTNLFLYYNPITTLPAPIFETFLDAHPKNYLFFYDNPFICDERLSWLKSRRDELKSRVVDTKCSNDPGHTVFDSDLIP